MKIAVGVHGRWHAFELAAGLHHRGHLSRLLTTYPAFVARRFLPADIDIAYAASLELKRRLHDRFGWGAKPDLDIARRFGRFAVRHLPAEFDLYVGWSSATLEVIEALQPKGIPVVLERGSTHIAHQDKVLATGCETAGVSYQPIEPGIVEREVQEYASASAIAVPTEFAAETFRQNGVPPDKLFVNPYGVDLARFRPRGNKETRELCRILFVGAVGVRKGAAGLVKAAESLAGRAEVIMAGPIEDVLNPWLEKNAPPNLVLKGPVPSHEMPGVFGEADVFCLPSLEEGFPLSLLQAMAAGLPCVTTE
ncbi:MAG: glycosyltransferase family 4 protein, partial [Rhodospirillaceae bacterium]